MKQLAENFWNFRGSFKVAKIIDLGTQMSLLGRTGGRFTLIDSYGVSGADRKALLEMTENGAAIDTIVNVHPFHTLHCTAAHELAPAQSCSARRGIANRRRNRLGKRRPSRTWRPRPRSRTWTFRFPPGSIS